MRPVLEQYGNFSNTMYLTRRKIARIIFSDG